MNWLESSVANAGKTPLIFATSEALLPASSAIGALAVTTDSDKLLRWSGERWVEIGGGGGGGITGSGTVGKLPKFTEAEVLGDSIVIEFANNLFVTGPVSSVGFSAQQLSGYAFKDDNGDTVAEILNVDNKLQFYQSQSGVFNFGGTIVVNENVIIGGFFQNDNGDNAFNATSGNTVFGGADIVNRLNVKGGIHDLETRFNLDDSMYAIAGTVQQAIGGNDQPVYNAGVVAGWVLSPEATLYTPNPNTKQGALSSSIYLQSNIGGGAGISNIDIRTEVSGDGDYASLFLLDIYGLQQQIGKPTYTGTVAEVRAAYIRPIKDIGIDVTAAYAIYQEGISDKNYFAGEIELGNSMPLTNSVNNIVAKKLKIKIGNQFYYLLISDNAS